MSFYQMCLFVQSPPQSKYKMIPPPQRSLSSFPFMVRAFKISSIILKLWQLLICFPFYNFVISIRLYKWNHTFPGIMILAFFTQHNTNCCMHQKCVPSYCWPVFHGVFTTVCLIIHQLRDIFVASSLGLLKMKLLWTTMHRCLCGHKFSFYWDKRKDISFLLI